MKVICIYDHNYDWRYNGGVAIAIQVKHSSLTIGNMYDAIQTIDGHIEYLDDCNNYISTRIDMPKNICFLIKNDAGHTMWYDSKNFESLTDMRDKKINKILTE